MRKVINIILIALLSALVTIALYENRKALNDLKFKLTGWDDCTTESFVHKEYKINDLDYGQLPYVNSAQINNPQNYNLNNLVDENGVLLFEYKGKKSYHPVYLAQYSLFVLDRYHQSKNEKDLEEVVKIANKLTTVALEADGTLLFPYVYDFVLHGRRYIDKMEAPWYSALAQGQVLSLFVRLYEETGDSLYLDLSSKVFNSFYRHKYNHDVWISCIDQNNNIWFEEYPADMPCFTLNGMVYAIYGIYDFYRITKRADAKELLSASITTIENNIDRYRNEGEVSYYCLKHAVGAAAYHGIHIQQLNTLYLITGEQRFKETAEEFKGDHE